jgi:hypothetical protein
MNAGLNLMFLRDSLQKRPVTDLAAIKRHIRVHGISMAAAEIVNHDDSFAHFAEQLYCHTADVPGPSGH